VRAGSTGALVGQPGQNGVMIEIGKKGIGKRRIHLDKKIWILVAEEDSA
jgi:hypothetical protein